MIMRIILSALVALTLQACAQQVSDRSSIDQLSDGSRWWTGIVAVEESDEVWRIMRQSDFDPAVFNPQLEAALKAGTIKPATGTFVFMDYFNGAPTGETHVVTLRPVHNGTWYFAAPGYMKAPGHDMCIKAPSDWPAIAGQHRYPANGGPTVNCHGGIGARYNDPSFATSNRNAATIYMVKPAG